MLSLSSNGFVVGRYNFVCHEEMELGLEMDDNAELLEPLTSRCPGFVLILSYVLADKFSFRVQGVDFASDMTNWSNEDCWRVGCALSTFIRKRRTGEEALEAWRVHYSQPSIYLCHDVTGFEEFMVIIINNLARDSIHGMVYRVGVGEALSTIDAGEFVRRSRYKH